MTEIYIIRPRPGPRRRRTPELIERIVAAYAAGESLYSIGLQEGCGANAIKSILVSQGTSIRGRGTSSDSFRFTADRRRYSAQARDAA